MGSRKVFLASILRGVMPREWGAASRVNETWGGLAGGKVSNVVRKVSDDMSFRSRTTKLK